MVRKASDETARKIGRKMGVRVRQKGGPIPTAKDKERRRKGRRREDWKEEEPADPPKIP